MCYICEAASLGWKLELPPEPLAPDALEAAGTGLESYTGAKPVWGLEQVISNLLRSNASWGADRSVAYSFREALPPSADSDIAFRPFNGEERAFAKLGFELIGDLITLDFVELPDDGLSTRSGNRIYLGVDTSQEDDAKGVWGYAQRWGGFRIAGAEVWTYAEATSGRDWIVGGYNHQALMHEILHAIGIPHPGDYNAGGEDAPPITYADNARYAQDSRQFTIMSYFGGENTGADYRMDSSNGLYSPSTPMLHDVAALQRLYGPDMTTRTGDTVYGYDSNAGRSVFDFDTRNANSIRTDGTYAPIFTIWDAGGTDTLNFSRTSVSVNLDLRQGAYSDAFEMTNNIAIAFGTVI